MRNRSDAKSKPLHIISSWQKGEVLNSLHPLPAKDQRMCTSTRVTRLFLAFAVSLFPAHVVFAETATQGPTLRFPEKIGVGAVPSGDAASRAEDINHLGARWFYNWQSDMPAVERNTWVFRRSGAAAQASAQMPSDPPERLHISLSGWRPGYVRMDALRADGSLISTSRHKVSATQPLDLPTPADAEVRELRLDAYTSRKSRLKAEVRGPDSPSGTPGEAWALTCKSGSAAAPQAPFVPMAWGRKEAALIALGVPPRKSDTLLAFNEPDDRFQANMTVEDALGLWPALMATGRRLSSPAATTPGTLGPNSWLGRFMREAEARGYRVDFMAVHYYSPDPDPDKFRAFLEQVHQAYKRPIWVTEWALADWLDPRPFSPREQAAYFEAATRMLDSLPFVERHAWFGTYSIPESTLIQSALIDDSGALTSVGEAFRRAAVPPLQKPAAVPAGSSAAPRPGARSDRQPAC